MKNYIGIILAIIFILTVVSIIVYPKIGKDLEITKGSSKELSVTKLHSVKSLSSSNNITCTYSQTLYAGYESGKITHELSKPEINPIIMTFSDIQTETPKIQFIDSTRTISEVFVIKIIDTVEKLMFLEGNGDPYLTVHTIYKKLGVGTYEKSVSLLGTPWGTISMGSCVNY